MTKFRTDVALREKSSDTIFSDKLRFIYLSLPFFTKSEEECESGFEKWIYVLKYMEMDEVFKNLPLAEQKKMLDHLAKLPDVRFLSSEEQGEPICDTSLPSYFLITFSKTFPFFSCYSIVKPSLNINIFKKYIRLFLVAGESASLFK